MMMLSLSRLRCSLVGLRRSCDRRPYYDCHRRVVVAADVPLFLFSSSSSSSRSGNHSSSNNNSNTMIPVPTWSIADLDLHRQHAPVSDGVFRKLARRALIDANRFDRPVQDRLRQDLGNMLHLIDRCVVDRTPVETTTAAATTTTSNKNDDGDDDPAVQLYDVPRNVTYAPVREDEENDGKKDMDETRLVHESFLRPQPNMVQDGAHRYFEIVTARTAARDRRKRDKK
jgi:hypothetical protein